MLQIWSEAFSDGPNQAEPLGWFLLPAPKFFARYLGHWN